MLLIFGGLPASGKSTISKSVAERLNATYLRIDTIEQTLRDVGIEEVQGEGYAIAYRIAADNLERGATVVADSVNPIELTRQAWRSVGESAGVRSVEIEVTCSSVEEHKHRVETRRVNIDKLVLPTWEDVLARDYEPWKGATMRIDTAGETPAQSVEKAMRLLGEQIAITGQ